jgi:hypothetical protein
MNLESVQLAGEMASRWLFRQFKVELSSTVVTELSRHVKLASQYSKAKREKNFSQLEQHVFGDLIASGVLSKMTLGNTADAGERHNYCMGVDDVRRGRYSQCVIITDDETALRAWLKQCPEIFPIGPVWTSVDLILHLYMTNCKQITRTLAANALKDLIAAYGSGPATMLPPIPSQKLARKLTEAIRRLDQIHAVIQRLC